MEFSSLISPLKLIKTHKSKNLLEVKRIQAANDQAFEIIKAYKALWKTCVQITSEKCDPSVFANWFYFYGNIETVDICC